MRKYLILLLSTLLLLTGCNKELKAFKDKEYYQLKSISFNDEFEDVGIYAGAAYCDTMETDEGEFTPDDDFGFIIHKITLDSKMDNEVDLNELFQVKVKIDDNVYTSKNAFLDETGKNLSLYTVITKEDFNRRKKDLRAIITIFDDTYRISSDYYYYDGFRKELDKTLAIVGDWMNKEIKAFEEGSKILNFKTLGDLYASEECENLKNLLNEQIVCNQKVPEIFRNEFDKFVQNVINYKSVISALDYKSLRTSAYVVNHYGTQLATFMVELVSMCSTEELRLKILN